MSVKEDYISFCETHDWVPLFHRPYWWDAVLDNWDVEKFEFEKHVAYLPYASYKKWGFSFSRNPFLTPYSGLLFSETNYTPVVKQNLFEQAQQFLSQYGISQYDSHPLLSREIESKRLKTTFLLDTQNEFDEIKKSFSASLKRQLKKAEKCLTLVEDQNIDRLYSIYTDSLQRQNSQEIVPFHLVESVFSLCKKQRIGKILLAQDEAGNTHAAIGYVMDKNCGYYLLGGSRKEFLGSGAMGFLLQYCIQFSIAQGKSFFDFEGSEVEGVARFFSGFGGTKTKYPVLSAPTDPKLNALLKLKGLLRK